MNNEIYHTDHLFGTQRSHPAITHTRSVFGPTTRPIRMQKFRKIIIIGQCVPNDEDDMDEDVPIEQQGQQ